MRFFGLASGFFLFIHDALIELDDFEIKISVFFLLNLNPRKEFDLVDVVAHLLDGDFHLVSEGGEF